jgi:hypothetical protein
VARAPTRARRRAGAVKRDPIVVGKPAEFMLANIAAQFGLQRGQICMVGDRLDTDILFGQQGGLSTLLVLSGAAPRSSRQGRTAPGGWAGRVRRAASLPSLPRLLGGALRSGAGWRVGAPATCTQCTSAAARMSGHRSIGQKRRR